MHLSTTFARDAAGDLPSEYSYARYQNPNRDAWEACIASLEDGAEAAAFASGSAAANAVLQALDPGSRVVCSHDLYHGTRTMMTKVWSRAGFSFVDVDLRDDDAVETVLADGVTVVWCESPTNPRLEVVDLPALAARCRNAGTLLLVDNTFATPLLQQPLALGADLVLHATTKYLSGHSDVTGGVLLPRDPSSMLWERIRTTQRTAGAVPSPFDCWLALRGVSTLWLRLEAHCTNAAELARRLDGHAGVERVYYPGLPDHPDHALASRQMARFGGMLSFLVAGGEMGARAFTSKLSLLHRATSLGGVHTLIEHRMLVEPPDSPVPRNLVRLSAGIEDVEDLWDDLDAALSEEA